MNPSLFATIVATTVIAAMRLRSIRITRTASPAAHTRRAKEKKRKKMPDRTLFRQ